MTTRDEHRMEFKINLFLTRFTKTPRFVTAFALIGPDRCPFRQRSSRHHRGVIRRAKEIRHAPAKS
jgi:hypothetical protein